MFYSDQVGSSKLGDCVYAQINADFWLFDKTGMLITEVRLHENGDTGSTW